MARSLGISLQSDRYAFVILEGSAKRYSVHSCGEGTLPRDARGLKQLGKALAEAVGTSAEQVAISLPTSGVVLREIGLPFSEREKVMQVLKFEIESALYHLDVDEVICDYIELEDDRATPTLLVSVLPKEHMDTALGLCAGADWDPETVGLSIGALYNAVGELARTGEETGDESYLHVGADTSLLLLLNGDGSLRAARGIPLGWRELARGMTFEAPVEEGSLPAEDAETDEEEEEFSFEIVEGESEKGIDAQAKAKAKAEAAKAEEDEDEEEESDQALAGAILGGDPSLPVGVELEQLLERVDAERMAAFQRRLANDLRRGLEAMESGRTRLNLMGAALPGLADFLAARLGREVAPLDLGFADDDGNFADPLALGIALRGIGIHHSPMNFRQEEYRYARGLERVEGPLTLAMVGIIAFMVVDMVLNFKQVLLRKADAEAIYAEADKKVESLNARVREDEDYPDEWIIKNDLSGVDVEEEGRISLLYGRVEDSKEILDKLMGEAEVQMPPSCLEAWRLVMEYLDEAMADWPDRWMVENFDMTSVDARGRDEPAYVQMELTVTLISENAQATADRYDKLEQGLSDQPWSARAAAIPSTEAADVPGARTATVTCYVMTEGAQP